MQSERLKLNERRQAMNLRLRKLKWNEEQKNWEIFNRFQVFWKVGSFILSISFITSFYRFQTFLFSDFSQSFFIYLLYCVDIKFQQFHSLCANKYLEKNLIMNFISSSSIWFNSISSHNGQDQEELYKI